MVRILIKIIDASNSKPVDLIQLKHVMDLSLTEVKSRVKDNSRLVEYPLFCNDHDEIVNKVFRIIEILKGSDVKYSVHEVPEGIEYFEDTDLDAWALTEEMMVNLLDFD